MTLTPLLIAIASLAVSGAPGLLAPRGARWGAVLAATLMVAAGILGSVCAGLTLARGLEAELTAEWFLPWGRVWLHLDPLGAAFLLPVFVVPALGGVYGVAYWPDGHAPAARSLRVFFGVLAAAMALVVLAKDGVFFLMVWEVMALAAFFAVCTEDTKPDVRRAAWVYFVATHLGTLALIAMFAVLRVAAGQFDLAPLASGVAPALATAVFVLALVGFGVKAGIAPLHVWLPGAHANAPSHVSAVLSGVMLKMGVYGIVRVCSLLPEVPLWWGWLLVGLGAGSALLGITFAVAQSDYKRLLAYSSIENVGVIMLGVGAALLGRALHDPGLTALATAGALLHVWNHALFKPLLFLVAGSVLHATGTRDMSRLGGLARVMPWTTALACVGCVAIGALPPLNGFVSEWLIYQGLLGRVARGAAPDGVLDAGFAGAVAALALTGALASVAFVRLFGVVFLGAPRSAQDRAEHEAPPAMLAPACVLALACVAIGTLPFGVTPCLRGAVRIAGADVPEEALRSVAPGSLRIVGGLSVGLLVMAALLTWGVRRFGSARAAPRAVTWDCGYTRPSPRMQYGPSSLGQMVAGLFAWVLSPRTRSPDLRGPFPPPASLRTEIPDAVLDRAVLPGLHVLTRLLLRLRLLQRGKVQVYMLYILLVVVILLLMD